MGVERAFFSKLHISTKRDYLARVMDDKVHCMEVARKFGRDFFDGERRYGFGGYKYDGRWLPVAEDIAGQYGLKPGARILEAGCGKGYLLYEFTKAAPGCELTGFDISEYAIENGKPEIRDRMFVHDAANPWPFADKSFDLVISIAVLHNLRIGPLKFALSEMNRVAKQAYLCVEGYRTPAELFAMQCWALTAEAFFADEEWVWLFNEFGYTGDYEFIHF